MAALSKNYNSNQIILGPCDVWLNVGLPATTARLVLTNGTPDDGAGNSPNAIHLGMTEAGVTFEYTPEVQDFSSDELTAPHLSRIVVARQRLHGVTAKPVPFNMPVARSAVGAVVPHDAAAGVQRPRPVSLHPQAHGVARVGRAAQVHGRPVDLRAVAVQVGRRASAA